MLVQNPKVSKSLKWLLPFLHAVEDMIPNSRKIKEIRSLKFSFNSRDRMYGELAEYEDKSLKLSLRTHFQHIDFYPLTVTKKSFSKIDMLASFAHELAHCVHWTHTPEHKILENQILTVFMYKLKQQGYISEEEELK